MNTPASPTQRALSRPASLLVLFALCGWTSIGLAQQRELAAAGANRSLSRTVQAIDPEDPFSIINTVVLDNSGTSQGHTQASLPKEHISSAPVEEKPVAEEEPLIAPTLHPMLLALSEEDPAATVPVIVNLRETLSLPRLPELPATIARTTKIGQRLVKERATLIEAFQRRRLQAQRPLLDIFRSRGIHLQVREQFWIVNAFLADLRVAEVSRLARFPEVLFVQPRFAGEEPPDHDGNANNDTIDGRARINSDPYFDQGLTGGYIGLLDTGIRIPPHILLEPPIDSPIYRDCVNGGANCEDTGNPAYDPNDDCWNHGTSSAGIIQANGRKGIEFRGVTGITLDSFKVYGGSCGFLDSAAVLRGIQGAIEAFDSVIVYEMQAGEPDSGVIATAADNAYQMGRVINIAANGNRGPGARSVASPAIAHKVIGVGAYGVEQTTTLVKEYSGRGPATDGRFKPDITTPTDTETCSNVSNVAMRVFDGTSGATPYAGGAAMLVRNWLERFGTFDNGQVYSVLILAGQRAWPFDNDEGAGALELLTCGRAFWGKVSVDSSGTVIDIPIDVAPHNRGFSAALWWPESASEVHDDIDLFLIDPAGRDVARSVSAESIFERLAMSAPLATGTWNLRIKGFNVRSGPQTVYFAADARECPPGLP